MISTRRFWAVREHVRTEYIQVAREDQVDAMTERVVAQAVAEGWIVEEEVLE